MKNACNSIVVRGTGECSHGNGSPLFGGHGRGAAGLRHRGHDNPAMVRQLFTKRPCTHSV